ncbi:hypothetical protein LIER_39475 [Lithospermum erythrorhizon]|uniref:Uncharacterized protein n=1 Tax=Lithospermum erythrorhizon TaxID=34254 RepID=A0AAV3QGE0_LITER
MVDRSRNLTVQEQVDRKLLFTVSEVEEVKYISKIVPSFPTLFIYSIVEAAGTTLFFNQASEINKDFPVIRFYILKNVSSYCASILWSNHREKLLRLKILTGMLCSVLCSMIAWRVEIYTKQSHVTISIWWLTPQFIFLGLMEGLLKDGIEGLFKYRVSESMGVSGTNLVQFMIGIGRFLSFLFVLKLGRRHNEINRFGRYYYGFLVVTNVVNASISGPILYTFLKELPMVVSPTPTSPSTLTSPTLKPPPSPSPPSTPTSSKFKPPPLPLPSPSPPSTPSSETLEGRCTPEEETKCHCPSSEECGESCNHKNYPDYNGPSEGCKATDDCCPFSDGNTNPQLILDCPPWIPDWNCISSIEESSTNCPPCICGCDYNNGPPTICNPWIVIDDCTTDMGDNIYYRSQ